MPSDQIKLAFRAGYNAALEKHAGVAGTLFKYLVKKPTKGLLKAFLDPVLGLSQAGTNAEIRRRTGKWIRNQAGTLTIPAGNGLLEKIIPIEPESVHMYHRPAAILHHLFLSGPNANLHRLAAGSTVVGVGGTIGAQKVMKRIEENRENKRKPSKGWW
jgi:hypothetical protein